MVTRVLIMAGGTGGHVFPALAVAQCLRGQGVEVVWMGTRKGLEADVVIKAGFAMEWISVSGLRGKGLLSWLLAPLRLSQALLQALVILLRCRPMAVLGMGGFVSGPGGLMAWFLKRPLLIHEQNAVAGLTNRLLARLADRVLEGFPAALPARFHPQMTGNPVRKEIAALAAPDLRYSQRQDGLRLLVLGGSLGAQALNEVVPKMLALLPTTMAIQVWHQAGRRNIDAARAAYANSDCDTRNDNSSDDNSSNDESNKDAGVTTDAINLVPFIDDMAEAYGWADLVLCRAGALTVAELAAAGVAAILVPYPHAVDDHQSHNAAWLVDVGAAVQLPQSQLTPQWLAEQLNSLWQVDNSLPERQPASLNSGLTGQRQQLLQMAQKARAIARVDAAEQVAAACLEVANG